MEIEIRVRYQETDKMGIAHHSSFFSWLEMGRVELLRERGFSYVEWEKAGFHLPITELQCQYLAPVYFDDLLTLKTEGPEVEKLRLTFSYILTKNENQIIAAKAKTTHVVVNAQGKPVKWPAMLKQFLEMDIYES